MTTLSCHGRAKCNNTFDALNRLLNAEKAGRERLMQQHDAALAGLSRLAKYPLTRADELSAEQMRDIARDYMAKAGESK